MAANEVTALRVADQDFMVASTIERCPKVMMLRELVKNSVEAAQLAPEAHRRVEIKSTPIDGIPKLTIWNTGPGMDAEELLRMCDLASSIGKQKGLNANFGMGAKVASLPSNQRGIRYRSCKNGVVHEVTLCKREGVYGRLRYEVASDEYQEVIDVTDSVRESGQEVSFDWTEVLLHGNSAAQNTVKNPFDGDPEVDAQWIATYLYHRFYRLPDGVQIRLNKGTNKLDGNRSFFPIPDRLKFFERYETVETGAGRKIHYLYDGQYIGSSGPTSHGKSVSGAIASAVSTCAVVYRDEMYALLKGREWTLAAPLFGIPFGSRYISVHVELPADAALIPDGYRQFLRYSAGEQEHVEADDFADEVRDHMPEWLRLVIKSFAPDSQSSDEVRNELQKLLTELRVKRNSPKVQPSGSVEVSSGTGQGSDSGSQGGRNGQTKGRTDKPTDLSILPKGAKKADIFRNIERAPEIIELRNDAEIEEKELRGRAARFYIEASQLFVNMTYPAISEMVELLTTEYASAGDPELVRSLAVQHAERTMLIRVGRTVVYALAKQLNREWDLEAVNRASSPESLSMAADDFADSMQNVRRAIGKTLRPPRGSSDRQDAEPADA
jgi:hypothetical protein